MSHENLNAILRARNSSGNQELHLTKQGQEYSFTLVGELNGKSIQIDFESMSKADLHQYRNQIDIILNA